MSTQIWLRPLCLASTVLLGACAGPTQAPAGPRLGFKGIAASSADALRVPGGLEKST